MGLIDPSNSLIGERKWRKFNGRKLSNGYKSLDSFVWFQGAKRAFLLGNILYLLLLFFFLWLFLAARGSLVHSVCISILFLVSPIVPRRIEYASMLVP